MLLFSFLILFLCAQKYLGMNPDTLFIKGGAVSNDPSTDYYEQFHLDYGLEDTKRIAGSLRGFIKPGALSSLPQSDTFLKWLHHHLEEGPQPFQGRLKAYYVIFFFFQYPGEC
jgi:hypothetical protein